MPKNKTLTHLPDTLFSFCVTLFMSMGGVGMSIRVCAFGKINLFLDVLNKRQDGYHSVHMIMQSVRMHDVVHISEYYENKIVADSPYVPNNKNNLAMRAAELMQKMYDLPPVAIRIQKSIPVSAGMAGGSSDAAAVLLGMNRLFRLNESPAELMALGSKIGSDVPFCMYGGTALASERGEVIAPLPLLPKIHIILFKANFGVSTQAVYGAYSVSNQKLNHDEMLSERLKYIYERDVDSLLTGLYNALEPTAFSMYPRVEALKSELKEKGAQYVLMSGSGPTVFAAFLDQREGWSFYRKMRKNHKMMYMTSTVSQQDLADRFMDLF